MGNAKATHGAVEALPSLKIRREHKVHRMKDHDQAVYTAILWGSYEYSAWTPRPPAGAGEVLKQGAIWAAAGRFGGWVGGFIGGVAGVLGANQYSDEHHTGTQLFPLQTGLCKCKRSCD